MNETTQHESFLESFLVMIKTTKKIPEGIYNTGTFIFLDLDNFGECVRTMGWSEYTPNPISAFLTDEVEHYIHDRFNVLIWGLDQKRGTEEAIILSYEPIESIQVWCCDLIRDVKTIAEEFNANTSLSCGIATGIVSETKAIADNRSKTISRDPLRRLAYKALRQAKKKGGNRLMA
jgi:GGDEF domain-containing protein